MDSIVTYIITGIAVPLFLYYVRSTGKKMSIFEQRLSEKLSRKDTNDLIDLKQESLKGRISEVKEDCREIKEKIDKIYDRLLDL